MKLSRLTFESWSKGAQLGSGHQGLSPNSICFMVERGGQCNSTNTNTAGLQWSSMFTNSDKIVQFKPNPEFLFGHFKMGHLSRYAIYQRKG